ncbi:hypothetical protein BHE74_00053557 [Ensete ventricosum]|nr:hypothetical protein BHE74_00053557 [Ensete ventricosum]RZS25285.1 hypothetical protein BHM03_00058465 [Ensete ventricosum]
MDTARTGWYVSVRPLTRAQTARYRAIPPIRAKKREKKKREKKKKKENKRENLESGAALPIHRPWAISSLARSVTHKGDFFSSRGER